jgi:hypothetical protein
MSSYDMMAERYEELFPPISEGPGHDNTHRRGGSESFQLFGSFDGASLTDESLPLIVTARAQPAGS